jgi:hypothetical protein
VADGGQIPTICGTNNGQHIIYSAIPSFPARLSFVVGTQVRLSTCWNFPIQLLSHSQLSGQTVLCCGHAGMFKYAWELPLYMYIHLYTQLSGQAVICCGTQVRLSTCGNFPQYISKHSAIPRFPARLSFGVGPQVHLSTCGNFLQHISNYSAIPSFPARLSFVVGTQVL